MVYTQTQQTAMSIFFDSNITFLLREGTITNSIIKMKRICNLLTRQSESFGDLERSIYLSQQEHGCNYQVLEQSSCLLLGIHLTLRKLFPSSSHFARVVFEERKEFSLEEILENKSNNEQLFEIVSECDAFLETALLDLEKRQRMRQQILELCAQLRFNINVCSPA